MTILLGVKRKIRLPRQITLAKQPTDNHFKFKSCARPRRTGRNCNEPHQQTDLIFERKSHSDHVTIKDFLDSLTHIPMTGGIHKANCIITFDSIRFSVKSMLIQRTEGSMLTRGFCVAALMQDIWEGGGLGLDSRMAIYCFLCTGTANLRNFVVS